jgi:hypothetical protein
MPQILGEDAEGEEGNDDEEEDQDYEGDADDGDTAKQGGHAPSSYPPSPHQKRKKVFVPVFVPEKEKKKSRRLTNVLYC